MQRRLQLQAQALNVVRQRFLCYDTATALLHGQGFGLLHFDANRTQWHTLAGQDGALGQFVF